MDDASSRKRPRPVVSCLRCREKKLKCDRTAPCENCIKAQCGSECTYNQYPSSKTKNDVAQSSHQVHASGNPPGLGSVEDLQQRVAKLEDLLSLRPSSAHTTTQNSPALSNVTNQSSAASPRLLGTLVVKGSRSRYHGQNDRVTLLNQFIEAKEFINDIAKDPQVTALAKQVQFLQGKSQSKITSPDAEADSEFSLALLKLREFLPPKSICDRLVDIYCRHFERTMRILHIPTFMRQYNQIWANTDPEICKSSCTIPQVTAVLCMAYAMDDPVPANEDTAHRSYLKNAAIELTQAWLDELGRKQRTELPTIQVEALLLLARSLRQMPPEKIWSSTGALVRSAMVMGLHMDSSGTPNISPFQAEMRRRVWVTIIEMDLQASMNAGMPIVAPDLDFAPLIPANLDDSDFDDSSMELPNSKPLSVMTDSLAQVYLASSLPQRIKVMSLLQGASVEIDVAEAVKHGRRVEEFFSRKPSVLGLDTGSKNPSDTGSLLHRVLLDLYMRRPLLCLYRPLLLGDRQDHPVFSEIQRACLESSLAILSYQNHYDSRVLKASTGSPSSPQNFFYLCCKNDVLWAALSVCQHIKLLHHTAAARQASGIQPINEAKAQSESTLIKTVEGTIERLIHRIGQRGSDLKDIVFLSVALQSVRSPSTSQDKGHIMYEGAKKTLSDCRENLMQSVVLGDQGHSVTPPPSTNEVQYMADLPQEQDQFLADLADLATEFDNFQGDVFGFGDAYNVDIDSNWNWDHMWQ
ncbi:hypothetical protein K469DRAFT_730819 [Zopfia rhizophila CBS 207.26]|uniref:Zn(2)-C6 fungal-type domain-containing protein n=1 Tax=Zopfia rhizophila CBS 207.26 TaxID=1314779 RepID=A0A6A6EN29_9PEZI|nr:hypothetical protein K469DRAFT_730819 [Zopfia rhizophila CBS 207.26]